MINESILQQKIHALLQYPMLNKAVVTQVGDILTSWDEWTLFRINPLLFAKQQGLNANDCIDVFVHGTKIGLFDLSYHLLCPACHGIVHNYHSLGELANESLYCALCDVNAPMDIDEQMEVSFMIHPSVKTLSINPFSNVQNYMRYHFSDNYQDAEPVQAYLWNSVMKGWHILAPDEHKTVSLTTTVEQVYQLVCLENNASFYFPVNQTNPVPQQEIVIDLLPTASKVTVPTQIPLPVGSYELQLKNHTNQNVGCLLVTLDKNKFYALVKQYPTTFTPFLTAKMLLNNQSFRDLFRVQQLSENFNVNVKNLTVMFTDLRGSTEMYDKAGDVLAYQLVQAHFQVLTETVRQFSGAIVKTMGDAIMATFSRPLDGFLASLEMLRKIKQMNETWREAGYEIGLKVGINEGPALAVVNDEKIDYFGQSVNIAARVQGLAQAGEVWISQSVLESPGVSEKLATSGYQTEQHAATLKGVGQRAVVHKVFQPHD